MKPTLLTAAAWLAMLIAAQPAARAASPSLPIIPAASRCEVSSGSFALNAQTKILWRGAAAQAAAEVLQAGLSDRYGQRLGLERAGESVSPVGSLHLEQDATAVGSDEAYQLVVTPAGVTLRARAAAGLFYGVQSLLQLSAPGASSGAVQLPVVRLEDQPRFAWRGLMLDESRHFFGKQTVKELLDMMAYLKLNRFHWHLTDEPGWRIEIKKYPRLTTVGGKGTWSNPNAPAAFYTQDDIREIVAYAAARHILIIPEIDMPGHATAATRAYPEFSGGGAGQWAGFTFNPAKEETYRFLADVLKEVVSLFPGPYVHLGGDEVHFGNKSWSTDAEIVGFAKAHNLTNAVQLEQYFLRRMAGVVASLGKTTLGWDEMAGASLNPEQSVMMWWRHDKPSVLRQLLEKDYPVVLCPRHPCYFDFVQYRDHDHGRRWNGINDLARVYNFPEPVTDGFIPAGKEANVLGVQACVWTERIPTRERLGFMVFPRLAALAEAGWTPAAAKNEADFLRRVPLFLQELARRRMPYFNPFTPALTPEPPGPMKVASGTANG